MENLKLTTCNVMAEGIHEIFLHTGRCCRLYGGERVRGELKYQPEDFVVTEIGLDGQMVTLDLDTPIAPPPVTDPVTSLSDEDEGGGEWEVVPDPPTLNETQIESLKSLSEKMTSIEAPPLTTPTDPELLIALGCYDNREARIAIHKEVKDKFPLLETITRRDEKKGKMMFAFPDKAYWKLHPLIGHDEAIKLLHFIKEFDFNGSYTLPPIESKDQRREIHHTLQELYGNMIDTHTETHPPPKRNKKPHPIPSTPSIRVRFQKRLQNSTHYPTKKRKSNNYYTSFVLKKTNVEMTQGIVDLAKIIGCRPNHFSIAGTKDKRAITYQRVTGKNISMKQLADVNCPLYEVGSFEYVDRPLSLGDLMGNHFRLLVRGVARVGGEGDGRSLNDLIEGSMSSLRSNGFINYFGSQRTGQISPKYHNSLIFPQIGLALLRDDPEGAVRLLLQPIQGEGPTQKAKEYFTATGDIEGTISALPWVATKELMVLRTLRRYGMTKFGCERAVMSIPHQSRVMFAHSFTSLLWNHLASYRIQEYGNWPVVGDLVMSDAAKNISERVHSMTSSDISSGRYSIHDVVIPLPGSEVTLPTNSVGTKLMEMLASIGLTLLSFKVRPRNRKFVIPGSYRRLVGVVKDVQWKMVPPSSMSQATPISSSSATPIESCDLEMEFKLDSGCYATVVLDEFSELNLTYY